METLFEVIQSSQLTFSQMIVVGVLIFCFGFFLANIRVRRLSREKHGLEKTVMALNEELLYGTSSGYQEKEEESSTPVIGLKTKNYKNPQIAK